MVRAYLARTLVGKLPSQSGITAHVCGDCSLQGAFAAALCLTSTSPEAVLPAKRPNHTRCRDAANTDTMKCTLTLSRSLTSCPSHRKTVCTAAPKARKAQWRPPAPA